MAEITSERVEEIMQETVPNPVKLTTEYVEKLGFVGDWADIDWFHWSYGNQFMTLTQEGIYPPDEPFVFPYYEGGRLKEVPLQYEHQLKGILEFLLLNLPVTAGYGILNYKIDSDGLKTYAATPLTGKRAKSVDPVSQEEWKEHKTEIEENKKHRNIKTIEPISRDRLTEILQMQVDNPIPLTGGFLEKEGFQIVWKGIDTQWKYSSADGDFFLYETAGKDGNTFSFHYYDKSKGTEKVTVEDLENITVQYEHQLLQIMEYLSWISI